MEEFEIVRISIKGIDDEISSPSFPSHATHAPYKSYLYLYLNLYPIALYKSKNLIRGSKTVNYGPWNMNRELRHQPQTTQIKKSVKS